jgi:hypothetical protein
LHVTVDSLSAKRVSGLTDSALSNEIRERMDACRRWERAFHDELVPFARAMALLGRIYNDYARPVDPYEFVDLPPHPRPDKP